MSRSKRLGSIYANNRKRRIVSDDESEQEEANNWTEDPFSQHQQETHGNDVTGDRRTDPVARCEAKLHSLRLHLSNLLREVTEVEKEIGRWEWEVAAVRKASRERVKGMNWDATDHGYELSGSQKRRRVVRWQDEEDTSTRSIGWGPADEGAVATIGNNQYASKRRGKPLWECEAGEPIDVDEALEEGTEEVDMNTDRNADENGHGEWKAEEMDINTNHSVYDGHGEWKLLDYIPRIKQTFEVVIPSRPTSAASVPASTSNASQPILPLFFEADSEDDSEDAEYISSEPELSPQTLLVGKESTKMLCFSPLNLSAGPTVNLHEQPTDQQDWQPQKEQHELQRSHSFTPLSLVPSASSPSTPLRMPTRLRPPSSPSVSGVGGPSISKDENTPKRTTSTPSTIPHSIGKTFVASPGFFGTFEQRRQKLMHASLGSQENG